MRKYDFDKMGGIWADQAREITERASLSHILEITILLRKLNKILYCIRNKTIYR